MQAFPPVESQLALFTTLGQKSAQSLQALGSLNMRLTQQLLEDAALSYQQLMASADAWQFATIAMKRIAPVSEHLRHYQQQLVEMFTSAYFTR